MLYFGDNTEPYLFNILIISLSIFLAFGQKVMMRNLDRIHNILLKDNLNLFEGKPLSLKKE